MGTAAGAGTRVLRGLIVDWGGVLTVPLGDAMASWAQADGVDFAHFADVMQHWLGDGPAGSAEAGAGEGGAGPGAADLAAGGVGAGEGERLGKGVLAELGAAADYGVIPASPVHALERGEISVPEFERELAAALAERGSPVPAEGLLGRVLGGLAELRPDMLGLVRRARSSGIRTALLSNSWGDTYDEEAWEGAFDVVVISGRVGMRKPEARIFEHTAGLLGLPVDECVMVDDLAPNVRGAVAVGMVGVLHADYGTTAEELEVLFDRPLH